MKKISPHIAGRTALILCCLTISAGLAWAQNENETVGFQSNHAFESGQFGEDIDILNGNLTLTVPIGRSYAVNQNFSYQLKLTYNSKIWDTTRYPTAVDLSHRSGAGLGWVLSFGRIYRDVETRGGDTWYAWYYVSPDGNEHDLGITSQTGGGCVKAPQGQTSDSTFYQLSWSAVPVLKTPDGIRYTFGHLVQVNNSNGDPFNTQSCVNGGIDAKYRQFNRDFGGWYVTLIEDTKSDWGVIADPASSRTQGGMVQAPGYVSWMEITYDSTPGREHLMSKILDTARRRIDFVNECVLDASAGLSL